MVKVRFDLCSFHCTFEVQVRRFTYRASSDVLPTELRNNILTCYDANMISHVQVLY